MLKYSYAPVFAQVENLKLRCESSSASPFDDVLPQFLTNAILRDIGITWRNRIFSPLVTVSLFIRQLLAGDRSCQESVFHFFQTRVQAAATPCSTGTSSYCKARERLPEDLFRRLTQQAGCRLHSRLPDHWQWKGRSVKLADGTNLLLPDTAANQAAYPQKASQAAGLGLPTMRLVALTSLGSGAVLDAAMGRYSGKGSGECALLRSISPSLEQGDVLVADAMFSGFLDLAFLSKLGVDVVSRPRTRHPLPRAKPGDRINRNDRIIELRKPRQRPFWLSHDQYRAMPETLRLRVVKVNVACRGFRAKTITIVTTLLDWRRYPPQDIADLYRQRWYIETDLRDIKRTMDMAHLRCRTPAMIRKEIWCHLLTYNLVRTVMAQAARRAELLPRDLSFKCALQSLESAFVAVLVASPDEAEDLRLKILSQIARHLVGKRPNRYEPRAIKTRAKQYRWLSVPREEARAQLWSRPNR